MLSICLIHSRQILDSSRFLGSFSIDSRHISRFIEIILCALIQLDSNLTASRFVETLLHALFFTCFASFFYLCVHSILFLFFLVGLWFLILLVPSISVFCLSPVMSFGFLYPLTIVSKRGRNLRIECYVLKPRFWSFSKLMSFH